MQRAPDPVSDRPGHSGPTGPTGAAPGLRFLPVGDAALLVELDSLEDTLALFRAIGLQRPTGVGDIVPAARTLLVQFQPDRISALAVAAWLRRHAPWVAGGLVAAGPSGRLHPDAVAGMPVRRIEIPVHYTGADLDAVAEQLKLTRAEVIERHTGSDYLAAFAGFAPGFVYLAGGDPCFHGIARRPSPRVRVPAGSVAVAGDFSAVYPRDSPGGWQLLGVTPWRMWDLNRAEPALVQPGFRVRFRDLALSRPEISLPGDADGDPRTSALPAEAARPSAPTASAPPSSDGVVPGAGWASHLEVLDAGLQTLFQDFGRPGLTHLGVSRSGALDRTAMRQANQVVGNAPGTPVLENVLGGLRLVCHGRALVAVTGAEVPVALLTASGVRLPAAAHHPLVMEDGQVLRIGRPRAGVRCYIAVRGGWAVDAVLGSCATDTMAGIGPDPIRVGDLLRVGPVADAAPPPAALPVQAQDRSLPRSGQCLMLDVILGPRADWFDAVALERLASQEWTVTPQSNRVGMRLSGIRPLPRSRTDELPSEGTVVGAVQVPANGQPVLFLADHPLTGGYPVIATVVARDLDRVAQAPVGAHLQFRVLGAFAEIRP